MPLSIDTIPAGGFRLIFEGEFQLPEAAMALQALVDQSSGQPLERLPMELDFCDAETVLNDDDLAQLSPLLTQLSDNLQIYVADVRGFAMARSLGGLCEQAGTKVDIHYRA